MSDVLKRITELARLIGANGVTGSKDMAELKGYAAGLDMILADTEKLECQVYPLTADGNALSLICNQFGIDGHMAEDEKRELISEGFKRVFGDYENGEMAEVLKKYGIGCTGVNGKILLSADTFKNNGIIENLGKILRNYLPPISEVVVNGSGLDFDYWDETFYVFDNYDRLDIPFYILDKLK